MNSANDFAEERAQMVREQLEERGIADPRVRQAFLDVPRHRFVPPEWQHFAYADRPLPIGHGQTISQPYVVAFMTEVLAPRDHEIVLEIGTGSGYQTAILARLANHVVSLEIQPELAEGAGRLLDELGIDNVDVHLGDGSHGLPDQAPFDAILVAAGAPAVPRPLLSQMTPDGRLVIPVGGRGGQMLERWRRRGQAWHVDRVLPVTFVPLLGRHGWPRPPRLA